MIYVGISLVTLLLLSSAVALIAYVIATNSGKIIDALLGRPPTRPVQIRRTQRTRAPVRTASRPPSPLRAAA